MQYRVDQHSGLQERPAAAPFPIGPNDLTEAVRRAGEMHAERIAIIGANRSVTFGELLTDVDRLAGKLAAIGITPGERVAVAAASGLDAVILFLSVIRAGGIWLGLHRRTTAANRERILAEVGAKIVLSSTAEVDQMSTRVAPRPAINRSSPAALGFTSGTTGLAKALVHSQQQLLYPGVVSLHTEPTPLNERIGTPLPLSTLNIMLLGPITALVRGSTYIDLTLTEATALAADVHRHGVTKTVLVPTLIHDLVAQATPKLRNSLSSLTTVLVGGSKMPPGMMAAAHAKLGLILTASYGLSEAPTGVLRRTADSPAQVLPGIDIAVDAVTHEITLAPDSTGPWARCWAPTLGYWQRPAATERLYAGGRLHTGDYGSVDADGHIEVIGRGVDMISRGATIIAPHEIERALLHNPVVEQAAAFGLPDPRLGERVVAAVVVNARYAGTDPTDLADATRPHLDAYKVPAEVHIVKVLPHNTAGKVDRQVLRQWFTTGLDD